MLRTIFFLVVWTVWGFLSNSSPALAAEVANPASPVVVELFTSQGCSSCPPADRLLSGLAAIGEKHQLPVYCLSFHVDYWDSLGWKDPYGSKLFTQRQRQYAAAFGTRRVYTPQMIVNGETEFVGSRGTDAQQAIQTAMATPVSSSVELQTNLSENQAEIELRYNITDNNTTGNEPKTVLNIAIVQKEAGNAVPRGENSGRELSHIQVVRALRTVPLNSADGKLQLKIPAGLSAEQIGIVAYVQNPQTMQITGAAVASL